MELIPPSLAVSFSQQGKETTGTKVTVKFPLEQELAPSQHTHPLHYSTQSLISKW